MTQKYFYRLEELDSEAKEVAWIEFKRHTKSKITLEEFLNNPKLTELFGFDENGIILHEFPF